MNGQEIIYKTLTQLNISFEYYEHPPAPTIEIARQYWKNIEAVHCKNLFFRNHKGNKHYLVIFDCNQNMNIHQLEKMLKQGKLSFASERRLFQYLRLYPGSISPFGLLNDQENHVYVFLDKNLQNAKKLSFHPNENTASLVITQEGFQNYLSNCGNPFEFIELYS